MKDDSNSYSQSNDHQYYKGQLKSWISFQDYLDEQDKQLRQYLLTLKFKKKILLN